MLQHLGKLYIECGREQTGRFSSLGLMLSRLISLISSQKDYQARISHGEPCPGEFLVRLGSMGCSFISAGRPISTVYGVHFSVFYMELQYFDAHRVS